MNLSFPTAMQFLKSGLRSRSPVVVLAAGAAMAAIGISTAAPVSDGAVFSNKQAAIALRETSPLGISTLALSVHQQGLAARPVFDDENTYLEFAQKTDKEKRAEERKKKRKKKRERRRRFGSFS